jgi:amidase
VTAATSLLAERGHQVRRADPPYPATLLNVWGRSWLAGVAREVETLGLDLAALEPRTRTMVRKGRRGPGSPAAWQTRALAFFEQHDVLVTPVTARGPGPAGALARKGYRTTYLASARAVPFCQAWNLAGLPALTAPVGVAEGRPLAVQLVGRPGSEELLLALAGDLEDR